MCRPSDGSRQLRPDSRGRGGGGGGGGDGGGIGFGVGGVLGGGGGRGSEGVDGHRRLDRRTNEHAT